MPLDSLLVFCPNYIIHCRYVINDFWYRINVLSFIIAIPVNLKKLKLFEGDAPEKTTVPAVNKFPSGAIPQSG
jgi:hypothetical protein